MLLISEIIEEAVKDVGIYKSAGSSVPGKHYNTALRKLRSIISELNLQSDIAFGVEETEANVTGDRIRFKPLTEAEQAIIDGGGTIDTTDRLTDFKPVTAPVIFIDGVQLRLVNYKDIITYRKLNEVSTYAFNVTPTESQVVFPKGGITVRIVRNIPITIDEDSFGYVHVDPSFKMYLANKLAEELAIEYKFTEELDIYEKKANDSRMKITRSNAQWNPQYHDFWAGINKFGD